MARVVWPELKLDAVSLGLVAIVVLPWMTDLLDIIEFPGGWKISFRALEEAAAAIPQLDGRPTETDLPTYLAVKGLDPELALVGLRIEIERRLQRLAEHHGVADDAQRSAGKLARALEEAGVLPREIVFALTEVIKAGNAASHGASLPSRSKDFAFAEGPRMLSWLDLMANDD